MGLGIWDYAWGACVVRMERDTGAVVSRLGALDVAGWGFEKGPGTEDRDGGLWEGDEGG